LCTTLLFAFVFAIVNGVDDSNNPFCMHDMKLGESSKTISFD
jgi:hypothetical protein